MKILLVQGSPHKQGSSNMLAEQFMEGAKAAGHTVSVFDAAHANIHPCNGCGACGMAGDCVQHDDMEKARKSILGSDMLVFVTPIYYFGMSAQLKMFIDRFYSFTTELSSKGMKTALITASWDTDDEAVAYLREHYQKICRYMHFQDQGMILGTGCGMPDMTQHTDFPKRAYELGKSIM